MKLKDLMENTTKGMPHLYLDMDGVQADFFGAWAQRHGLTHYKEIAHPEDAINELANSSSKEVYNFFHDLKPLQGGMQIIQWLHQNKIPFTVLSAPLRGPYASSSIQAKKDWFGDEIGCLPVFLEEYEITDNANDYVISSEIQEWLEEKKIGITMKKFGMEIKRYILKKII